MTNRTLLGSFAIAALFSIGLVLAIYAGIAYVVIHVVKFW